MMKAIRKLNLNGHGIQILLGDGSKSIMITSDDVITEKMGRPFLKWAGGKQWLAPVANALLPPDFNSTYYEPFLGGGAMFFSLSPKRAMLSDANEELINVFHAVKTQLPCVLKILKTLKYGENEYYRVRAAKPRSKAGSAARLIYLNRTCWNGLYRVNRSGDFNVPFGRYINPTICDEVRLHQASKILRTTSLLVRDFEESVKTAKEGDLVYFDPPYITGHNNNGFLLYNAHLFSWKDQVRLSDVAMNLAKRGVYVIVSNADHPTLHSLYQRFYKFRVVRPSLIGGKSALRGSTSECLFLSYNLSDNCRRLYYD